MSFPRGTEPPQRHPHLLNQDLELVTQGDRDSLASWCPCWLGERVDEARGCRAALWEGCYLKALSICSHRLLQTTPQHLSVYIFVSPCLTVFLCSLFLLSSFLLSSFSPFPSLFPFISSSVSLRISPLRQKSPAFLAPEIHFVGDNFSTNPGWRKGWLPDDSSALYLLCIVFLLLLHQLHLRSLGIRSQRLGTPGLQALKRPSVKSVDWNCVSVWYREAVSRLLLSSKTSWTVRDKQRVGGINRWWAPYLQGVDLELGSHVWDVVRRDHTLTLEPRPCADTLIKGCCCC